jgi:hypothetical protein
MAEPDLEEDERQDFEAAIREAGRNPDDFEITVTEEEPPSGAAIYVPRGSVRVRNRKTGHSFAYKTGQGYSLISGGDQWVEDFQKDLNGGKFD